MNAANQQTYTTSEIARLVGVHPNTVRLYEQISFLSQPERKQNGYRIFTKEHLLQARVIRLALQVEIVQNNLRKEVIEIIKAMAAREYPCAIALSKERLEHIRHDRSIAEAAITTVHALIGRGDRDTAKRERAGEPEHREPEHREPQTLLTRAAVAQQLSTTIDSLRNWEMNGLFHAKRKQNGYRVYTREDVNRLRIIKVLRDASYSLAAINRLMRQLDASAGEVNVRDALDTPQANEDILSVCDKLLTSLDVAEDNAYRMIELLNKLADIH